MRCRVVYVHPNTGTQYYFVDIRSRDGLLFPVGCFPRFAKKKATIFHTKRDALKVVDFLRSFGCTYCFVRPLNPL